MDGPYFKLENGTIVPIRFTRKLVVSEGYFDDKKFEIAINNKLRGEELTAIVIHECIHAEEPKWLEEVVEKMARRIAATLHMEPIAQRINE
jgi:hypothetical protein